jgi:hypothetical protein
LYQSEPACHVYRSQPDGSWTFEAIGGNDAILRLTGIALEILLDEIDTFTDLSDTGEASWFA